MKTTSVKTEYFVYEKVKKSDVEIPIPLEPIYFSQGNGASVVGVFPDFNEYGEVDRLNIIEVVGSRRMYKTSFGVSSKELSARLLWVDNREGKAVEEILRDEVTLYLKDWFGEGSITAQEFKAAYDSFVDESKKIINSH